MNQCLSVWFFCHHFHKLNFTYILIYQFLISLKPILFAIAMCKIKSLPLYWHNSRNLNMSIAGQSIFEMICMMM